MSIGRPILSLTSVSVWTTACNSQYCAMQSECPCLREIVLLRRLGHLVVFCCGALVVATLSRLAHADHYDAFALSLESAVDASDVIVIASISETGNAPRFALKSVLRSLPEHQPWPLDGTAGFGYVARDAVDVGTEVLFFAAVDEERDLPRVFFRVWLTKNDESPGSAALQPDKVIFDIPHWLNSEQVHLDYRGRCRAITAAGQILTDPTEIVRRVQHRAASSRDPRMLFEWAERWPRRPFFAGIEFSHLNSVDVDWTIGIPVDVLKSNATTGTASPDSLIDQRYITTACSTLAQLIFVYAIYLALRLRRTDG